MAKQKRELPMWIGGKAVATNDRRPVRPPHELKRIIGYSHHGDQEPCEGRHQRRA
jgi:hypothetical protein